MEQCTEEINQEVIGASDQEVTVLKDSPLNWVTTAHVDTLNLVSDAHSPTLATPFTPEQIRESRESTAL